MEEKIHSLEAMCDLSPMHSRHSSETPETTMSQSVPESKTVKEFEGAKYRLTVDDAGNVSQVQRKLYVPA